MARRILRRMRRLDIANIASLSMNVLAFFLYSSRQYVWRDLARWTGYTAHSTTLRDSSSNTRDMGTIWPGQYSSNCRHFITIRIKPLGGLLLAADLAYINLQWHFVHSCFESYVCEKPLISNFAITSRLADLDDCLKINVQLANQWTYIVIYRIKIKD